MTASNLQLRLATAAVGLPILAGLTYIGGWVFALVAGAVALMAAVEFAHGWLIPSRPVATAFSLIPNIAIPPIMVVGAHSDRRFIFFGLVLGLLMAVAGYSRTNALGPRKPYRVAAWSVVYTGLLISTFVLTRDLEHGMTWVFLGFAATFAADTGAYAVGRSIGRHKLAPKIQPEEDHRGSSRRADCERCGHPCFQRAT